jgi:hypothetical protein
VGLKLNGTHQLLAYAAAADDVKLLLDNIVTLNKNTESLIDSSKDSPLAIDTDIANRSFQNSEQLTIWE